ncbi:uncharacterized protein LOC17875922 isoform X2 [Capsella rubella]|uniref:uncharacterized protein LOC17875922 isoform X2 n=1 Tax=Capsella rubella TaxID=81985 RepID=UPI000CD530E3|nr:uncharacterized protein LOC17875922 isoform X2 [Capsella rubella]
MEQTLLASTQSFVWSETNSSFFKFLPCKRVKANAGALTNFEVLDFLNSRGASKDTTRVIAPIAISEYKVYDYLLETAASTQTRESVNKFADKCKDFKVAKAEILNIINLRPSSKVDLAPIIEMPDKEKGETRTIDTDGILELVKDLLPPLPTTDETSEDNDEEETENGEQS